MNNNDYWRMQRQLVQMKVRFLMYRLDKFYFKNVYNLAKV